MGVTNCHFYRNQCNVNNDLPDPCFILIVQISSVGLGSLRSQESMCVSELILQKKQFNCDIIHLTFITKHKSYPSTQG